MKIRKILLAVILLAIVAITPIPHAYSSTLTITVITDKPFYMINENITVYGNLTYTSSPVQDWPVALEVQDPYNSPVVIRTLQTDTNGAYSLTFKLPSNAKPGTYTAYVSSSYKGETATNNTKFKLIQITRTTVTIEGNDYTITIESNATIANVTATRNTLNFTSSRPTGQTAYVNVTIPVGLNQTEIKVFVDDVELIPPPYPIITTNGTHYFIYFEFTLSTHEIAIQYAIADIATTNVTPAKTIVGQGYTIRINATIQNQGHYEENFNVTVYANSTEIGKQTITLTNGLSTTATFAWNTTGYAKGNYTIKAIADTINGETDTSDNTKTADVIVEIGVPGDLNSDNKCNLLDLMTVALSFGKKKGDLGYEPNYDINNDNKINLLDLMTIALHFGETWTP